MIVGGVQSEMEIVTGEWRMGVLGFTNTADFLQVAHMSNE